jgi:hypothetical protein
MSQALLEDRLSFIVYRLSFLNPMPVACRLTPVACRPMPFAPYLIPIALNLLPDLQHTRLFFFITLYEIQILSYEKSICHNNFSYYDHNLNK